MPYGNDHSQRPAKFSDLFETAVKVFQYQPALQPMPVLSVMAPRLVRFTAISIRISTLMSAVRQNFTGGAKLVTLTLTVKSALLTWL